MCNKKQTQTQSQSGTSTSTPNVPTWVQNPQQSYLGGVSDLMQQGAGAFTPAGPNALQQQAGAGAASLGTSPLYGQAANMATGAAGAGANTSGASTYNPALFGGTQLGQANQYAGVSAGAAAQAQGGSLLDNLQAYMDPNIGAVVNTTLAGYDQQAARDKAAMDAQAGRDGAFQGSGYAIREGVYGADSALGRAQTEAGLRSNAFNVGAGLSAQDAAQRQQNSQFNTGQTNSQNQFNAGLEQQTGLANTGWLNDFLSQQGQLDQQTGLANQTATNQAGQFNASATQQAGQFNAGQQDNALARQLQAAGLLGNLGQAQGADARANVGTQQAVGDQQAQAALMQQQYPLQFAQIMQQLTGYNPSLYAGQTTNGSSTSKGTTTTSDPLGSLGALLGGAGALFSPVKIPGFA